MKKSFLFKWVSVLGATLLLANTVLPGLQVYADATAINLTNLGSATWDGSETYNFTSYATDKSTVYATGKVKVLTKWTVVNVDENYEVDNSIFSGKNFVVHAAELWNESLSLYQQNWKDLETNWIFVKVKDGDNDSYVFESFHGDNNKWWEWEVSIVNSGTVVTVEENYEADVDVFSGKSYYVTWTDENWYIKLYTSYGENPSATNPEIYVKAEWCTTDSTECDFVSYWKEGEKMVKWWNWKIEIERESNLTEWWTKVKVIENFMATPTASTFSGLQYFVWGIDYTKGDEYVLYTDATLNTSADIKVEIIDEIKDGETTYYTFKSYSTAETPVLRWFGKVKVDFPFTTVNVTKNYAKNSTFENKSFAITGVEYNENDSYKLYDTSNWNAVEIYIKLTWKDWNKYSFTSYSDENLSNEYAIGNVSYITWFTVVEVTENSVENFSPTKFVIYQTELSNPDTFYELYNLDWTSANIYVKISAYNVTFNSNGWTSIDTQVVGEWAKAKKPTDPTRDGYTFDKWYSDEALTKEWNFDSDTVNENVTLYAKWNQNQSSSSSSSSSSSRSSWWGGSSKSTTKTTTTTTWDTKTTTDTKATDTKTTTTVNTNDNTKIPAYNDKYSKEFNDAYQFAYKNGITTMPSIEEADMEWTLTRIAMAKMLSQYAINVLGKTPDTTKVVPAFPDVTAQMDADYNNGVTLAYQLWIMWIGIDKFRPDDLVTRAEFATALSRLLFNTPDGEWAYYETHLAKLMEEKIITNNNPDLQELRGYVMIMLMRSAQS